MKKIAILQSNYIPWKGYFDMIAAVDEFIIYDEVQFTKNDWRNRNKIKTPNGVQWLTIPVRQEHLDQKICETRVSDQRWADKHWKTLKQNYSRTPGFAEYGEVLAEIYAQAGKLEFLSDINLLFIRRLCGLLNIGTTISLCSDYSMEGDRIERLVNLCRQTAASVYISGPAARAYLDERAFAGSGIQLEWMDYSGYNPYPQPYGALEHGVSVVDLLFSVGAASPSYMKFRS